MSLNPPFGKTGLSLPPIVFGATSLGNLFHQPTDAEKSAIVRAWIGSGMSPVVIDSAGKYGAGLSLQVIGQELRELDVDPDRVLISNKLGWRRTPLQGTEPTFEPGVWINIDHDAVQDISYDGILRCWAEGNELLGNYRASFVSVHDPDEYLAAAADPLDREKRKLDIIDAYRALRELKDSGQVLAVGVGAKSWRVIAELDQCCDFDWVMLANSFTILEHPLELVEFIDSLAARKIAVINSALFHGGFLLGGRFYNYREIDPLSTSDAQRLAARSTLVQACAQIKCSVFDVGVAFGKSHPGISAVALSSSQSARVAEHVTAVDRQLSVENWQALRAAGVIAADYPYVP